MNNIGAHETAGCRGELGKISIFLHIHLENDSQLFQIVRAFLSAGVFRDPREDGERCHQENTKHQEDLGDQAYGRFKGRLFVRVRFAWSGHLSVSVGATGTMGLTPVLIEKNDATVGAYGRGFRGGFLVWSFGRTILL